MGNGLGVPVVAGLAIGIAFVLTLPSLSSTPSFAQTGNEQQQSINATTGMAVLPPKPTISDIDGNVVVSEVSAGQQLVVSYNYTNWNEHYPQPYVMVFDFRNEEGASEFIAWQSGEAASSSVVTCGISWVPEGRGNYEVRVFIISDFESTTVLSAIGLDTISVG